MKLNKTIDQGQATIDWQSRIRAFLSKAGYREYTSNGSPAFKRGSLIGSLAGFSPSTWKTLLTLSTSGPIEITLSVNTIGQIVTQKERAYWEAEFENIVSQITGGSVSAETPKAIAQGSLKENIYAAIGMVSLIFICGVATQMLFDSTLLGFVIGVALSYLLLDKILKFIRRKSEATEQVDSPE